MSGKTIILYTTLMLFSVLSKDSVQAQTRTTRLNDVGIELLGPSSVLLGTSLLGSVYYQRMITSRVGLQVGFTHPPWVSSSKSETKRTALGGKLYLPDLGTGSPFATGGIVLRRNSNEELDPVETEPFPYVGLGYEVRPNDRFVFRAALYALLFSEEFVLRSSESILPPMRVTVWPGIYFGYAF